LGDNLPKISIIGAGKVGISLAFHLQNKGYPLGGVASRTPQSLQRAKKYLKASCFTLDVTQAAREGEVVFISTNDDAISGVVKKIAEEGGFRKGQFVYHLSGASSLAILKPAEEKGSFVGSIHPLQTFPHIEAGIAKIPGTVFGITARGKSLALAKKLVKAVGGKVIEVRDEDKPLYHAAACIASNYLDALIYVAFKFYESVGVERKKAWEAMKPLVKATLDNIEAKGAVEALTGPIVRGDVETVKKHLQVIKEKLPHFLSFYCELGKITAEIALEKELPLSTYHSLLSLFHENLNYILIRNQR
jgi:predicted short-subunit dehydrogenase-like oxidoreductase (DUF2520 family)